MWENDVGLINIINIMSIMNSTLEDNFEGALCCVKDRLKNKIDVYKNFVIVFQTQNIYFNS